MSAEIIEQLRHDLSVAKKQWESFEKAFYQEEEAHKKTQVGAKLMQTRIMELSEESVKLRAEAKQIVSRRLGFGADVIP